MKLVGKANTLREFIQDTMLIDEPNTGSLVDFILRPVQNKYYDQLVNDYGSEFWLSDVDELIIKARKEGFTSLILGCFSAVMHLYPEARRFLEISYKSDATKQHYRRVKTFLLSPIIKDASKWTEAFVNTVFEVHTEGTELVLAHNKASYYVGSATSRTGERGGTVQGVLFTEAAHFPDTGILSASEVIEGTRQMVAVGCGMKFIETTANGYNHMRRRWMQARDGLISAKPRFFGWKEFYSDEEFKKVCDGFSDKSLIPQEYPNSAEEAFLTSGRPVFNSSNLRTMEQLVEETCFIGRLEDDGKDIKFINDDKGELTIWKKPRQNKRYLISADIAGGIDDVKEIDPRKLENRCWSVACVFDRSSWEVVAELRIRCNPGEFGRLMCTLGEYFNNAILAPELNNHGAATIEAIKSEGYSHLFKTSEIWEDAKDQYGFPTDEKTKTLTLTTLRNCIIEQNYKENSKVAIYEMYEACYDDYGKMSSNGWLDCVITRMIGLYLLKYFTLDDTYRRKDSDDSPLVTTSTINPKARRFRSRRAA